jgi:hypothetical protein
MSKVTFCRRKRPQSRSNYLGAALALLGVERSRSASRLPVALKAKVVAVAHADDLHLAWPKWELERIAKDLAKAGLQLKEAFYFVPGVATEHMHLRRTRGIATEGRYIRPNTDHILKNASLWGVASAKEELLRKTSHLAPNDGGEEPEGSALLDDEGATLHRRLVGTLIHVTLDRGDVCFCTRLPSRRLENPTEISKKS